MKKPVLVVMAAGMGSRFGGGIKQLEPVDYAFQDINDIPGTLPKCILGSDPMKYR